MAIRLQHNILVQIAADKDLKDKRFFPDTKLVVIDDFERQLNSSLSIAAASTEVLGFGEVIAVKGIYLELNGTGKVLLNQSAAEHPLVPAPGGTVAKLFLEGDLTEVKIKNEDADNALTGVYVIWGDLAP